MRAVYLCGGINALSDSEAKDWRETAKRLLQAYVIIDPMRRDYRGIENENWEQIVVSDLDDIRCSDIVLANAMRPSWGTAMEIRIAHQAGKPVIAFAKPPISPWLRYHAIIVDSLEAACEYICAKFST